MKSSSLCLLLLVTSSSVVSGENKDEEDRQGKFLFSLFSPFSIVRFANNPCIGDSSGNGTCMSHAECVQAGGDRAGSCASGYGVCCIITKNCGADSQRNCTYFQNPSYPSTYSTGGACSFGVKKISTDICQVRLDFESFELSDPHLPTGECRTDQFRVTGGSYGNFGLLCGYNTGQHVYIDVKDVQGGRNGIELDVNLSAGSKARWRIKASQIECDSTTRAPAGCDQYFMDRLVTVTSWSYKQMENTADDRAAYIMPLKKMACIRPEAGSCLADFSLQQLVLYFPPPMPAGAATLIAQIQMMAAAQVQQTQIRAPYIIPFHEITLGFTIADPGVNVGLRFRVEQQPCA